MNEGNIEILTKFGHFLLNLPGFKRPWSLNPVLGRNLFLLKSAILGLVKVKSYTPIWVVKNPKKLPPRVGGGPRPSWQRGFQNFRRQGFLLNPPLLISARDSQGGQPKTPLSSKIWQNFFCRLSWDLLHLWLMLNSRSSSEL